MRDLANSLNFNVDLKDDVILIQEKEQKNNKPAQQNEVLRPSIKTDRFVNNGNDTVTDLKTGLMWQVGEISNIAFEEINTKASDLKAGGYNDWRAPNMTELLSIVDERLNKPPFEDIFGTSTAEYFWSSDRALGERVWILNAGGGCGDKLTTDSAASGGEKIYSLKCVRGTLNIPNPRFEIIEDDLVKDNYTGLIWLQKPILDISQTDAIRNCSDEYRLPTMTELATLYNRSSNSIDTTFFKALSNGKYWTSSPLAGNSGKQWYIDFQRGISTYDIATSKMNALYVKK